MIICGIILLAIGGLLWTVGLSTEMAAPGASSVNIGLIVNKLSFYLGGGFCVVSGCILVAADRLRAALPTRLLATWPEQQRTPPPVTPEKVASRPMSEWKPPVDRWSPHS